MRLPRAHISHLAHQQSPNAFNQIGRLQLGNIQHNEFRERTNPNVQLVPEVKAEWGDARLEQKGIQSHPWTR